MMSALDDPLRAMSRNTMANAPYQRTWHRKWIILALLLAWMFLYRFRLMGILLSKCMTLQLAREKYRRERMPFCRDLRISIKHVMFRPLQFVHVEIRCGEYWTLVISHVTIHNQLKQFFRSFAHKKIVVVEVEDVQLTIHKLDEQTLRGLMENSNGSATQEHQTHKQCKTQLTPHASSPFGFMRFVDLAVRRLNCKAQVLDVALDFQCSNFTIGIIDVLVKQNLFNLRVQATDICVDCRHQEALQRRVSTSVSTTNTNDQEHDSAYGLSAHLPKIVSIVDVEISHHRPMAWKLFGASDDEVSLRVSTIFVELLQSKRIELIRKGLYPRLSTESMKTSIQAQRPSRHLPAAIELMDFTYRVSIIESSNEVAHAPITFSGELIKGTMNTEAPRPTDQGLDESHADATDEATVVTDERHKKTYMCAVIHSFAVKVGESKDGQHNEDCIFASSLECKVRQTHQEDATVDCQLGELLVVMNPRVVQAMEALERAQQRFEQADKEARALIRGDGIVATNDDAVCLGYSTMAIKPRWNVDARIISWRMSIRSQMPRGCTSEELALHGLNTNIRSTFLVNARGSSDVLIKHIVEVAQVSADICVPVSSASHTKTETEKHSLWFFGAELAYKQTNLSSDSAKVTQICAKFKSVSANGFENESFAPRNRLPTALFSDVIMERDVTETDQVQEVEMSVSINDADVKWSHQEHSAFLSEWHAINAFMERIQRMMTKQKAQRVPSPKSARSELQKSVLYSIRSTNACLRLLDVKDVTSAACFVLNECKFVHQVHRSGEVNAFTCADIKVLWHDGSMVMDVSNAIVHQKQVLGPQRVLTKVPTTTEIKMNHVKLYLRPGARILLLFLRLDEMVNLKVPSANASTPAPSRRATISSTTKTSVSQTVSISCKAFFIELSDKKDAWTSSVDNMDDFGVMTANACHVLTDDFEVKVTMFKHYELVESMVHVLQAVKKDESNQFLALLLAAPDLIDQIVTYECVITMSTMTVVQVASPARPTTSPHDPIATLRDTEFHFCWTEVTRKYLTSSTSAPLVQQLLLSASSEPAADLQSSPPRFLLFDVSALTQECEFMVEKAHADALRRVAPVFTEAFNSTVDHQGAGAVASQMKQWSWRSKFFGNIDVGFRHCRIVYPYGEKRTSLNRTAPINLEACDGLGEKLLVVTVSKVALNMRQFQKVALQLQSLRAVAQDKPRLQPPSETTKKKELSLQLLYLPTVKLDAVLQWKTPEQILRSHIPHFALSFDLVVRGSHVSSPSQVPNLGETLVSLNWDYIFPVLVYLYTDDDEDVEYPEDGDGTMTNDDDPAFICTGVQWNMSLDVLQLTWWDAMTRDACVLVVLTDFLTHGIVRNTSVIPSKKRTKPAKPSKKWVIWESTVYLDLFRGYLLRDAFPDTGIGGEVDENNEILPFSYCKVSDFFLETSGTSYRSTYIPETDSDGDEDDDLTLDAELVDFRFGDAPMLIIEKLHDSFRAVDYEFSLFGRNKLHRSESFVVASTLPHTQHVTVSTNSSSPSGPFGQAPFFLPPSPPKSPKSWTQTIRAKMARMRRRSSPTDGSQLNDGSRPIHVDSMKLLWTIETRDSVFYMGTVTFDSIQRLIEAKEQQIQVHNERAEAAKSPVMSPSETTKSPTVTIDAYRPANAPAKEKKVPTSPPYMLSRRGSTRDTLLELLHQGKLGNAQASSPEGSSDSHEPEKPPFARPTSTEEPCACKPIAFRRYIVDVHDAQINIYEESTRSSVLVGSKHVHMEFGLDDLQANSIVNLRLDSVTGHVAPIDVDISAGVLWYSYGGTVTSPPLSPQSPQPSSGHQSRQIGGANSALLKQVMEECSLTSSYMETLATGAIAVEADLSFMQLSTDRHQFYQLLNVVRHVLLAPPAIVRRTKRPRAVGPARVNPVDTATMSEGSEITVFPASPTSPAPVTTNTKKLHSLLLEELRSREAKLLNTASRSNPMALKHIAFRATGCQFRLRSSPETASADHEFVEIRVEGITGGHTYFENQCTKLQINLQWMEITNLRPGPSSIAFEDAMSVLKAKLLVDHRYQSSNKIRLTNQKGMLTIRTESGPVTRVLGQKLRVLDVLEISIFPEIPNMIVIQLAADFYDLVYKFFFEAMATPDHHHHHDGSSAESLLFGKKSGLPGSTGSMPSGNQNHGNGKSTRSTNLQSSASQASPNSHYYHHHSHHQVRRRSLQGSNSSTISGLNLETSMTQAASPINASSTNLTELPVEEDDAPTTNGEELFYFKYVRIGNVRLRINCNGFFVNLNNFDLDLPPYVCQSRLCTWKKLLQKFESHLKWYVTKESASSGLSHFKNKFLKWTPSGGSSSTPSSPGAPLSTAASTSTSSVTASSSALDKKEKKKDEDAAILNAQVLFGPYHASATGASSST